MSEIWYQMGFIRWPLAVSFLIVLSLGAWTARTLLSETGVPDLRTKAWVDAVLFWGGFALITGVLGTLVGLILAAQSVEIAGEVSPSLAWGGIKIALLSSVAGMVILAIAGLIWFGLQIRWRFLLAGSSDA